MSNNMKDRFVCSNFDEIDIVMDTDRKFDEALAAADAGETDLVDSIVKDIKECDSEECDSCIDDEENDDNDDILDEDDVVEYNPEDDDAVGILDSTAEDYREYVDSENYDDEDGEIIDCMMGHDDCE